MVEHKSSCLSRFSVQNDLFDKITQYYNLGSRIFVPVSIYYLTSKYFSLSEFAMIIKNQVPGCRSMVAKSAPVEDDPQRRRPDITVAKQHLHWEPKVRY